MTRDEAKKFFLRGYERGLRDMINEVLRLTSRGYGATELSVVLRSKLAVLKTALESIDRKIEAGDIDLGLEAPTFGSLRGRGSYLVREAKGERVYTLLKEIAAKGPRPMCISRTHPKDLSESFGIEPGAAIWLSRQAEPGVRVGSPTDLVGLTTAIHRHIEGGDAVVVLEGLEYLVSQNGFAATLRFVQAIHEKVVMKDAYLLVSANPDAFKEADYRQLAQAVTAEL